MAISPPTRSQNVSADTLSALRDDLPPPAIERGLRDHIPGCAACTIPARHLPLGRQRRHAAGHPDRGDVWSRRHRPLWRPHCPLDDFEVSW